MPAPAWEDLDAFFETDDEGGFATTATFVSASGQEFQAIRVQFDEPYLDKQLGEYSATEGDPRITCKEAEIEAIGVKKHFECTIGNMPGKKYTVVRDPQLTGTGTCVVYMAQIE